MLSVSSKGVIKLTRGDTAQFTVPIVNTVTKQEYVFDDDDVVKFTIKKTTDPSSQVLVQKTSTGSASFKFNPNDTKTLSYGDYVYDVELTKENGDVYTVTPPTAFIILEEVS